jgi:hypothetical protein
MVVGPLTFGAGNAVIPHDPTSDQWFSERQFAAYTTIERLIGERAVECAKNRIECETWQLIQ